MKGEYETNEKSFSLPRLILICHHPFLWENEMPDNQTQTENSQTLVIDADQFRFDTIEHHHGIATVVRFKLENPEVKPGDVLLILSGTEIHFHGFIGRIEDGWAVASDHHGSKLPARIH